MKKNDAIAVANENALLDAELEDEDIGFNPTPINIKINHSSAIFEIPGIDNVDTLEIVVLAASRVRVMFPQMGNDAITQELLEFTGNRPLCASHDYANGELVELDWTDKVPDAAEMLKSKIAEGALVCSQCPLNKWESVELMGKTGRGKACSERRRLCLWTNGWNTPVILSVPSSSIKAWDEYCSSLSIGHFKPHHVVTRLTLETRTAPGRSYSVIKFKFSSPLDDAARAELLTPVDLRGEEQSLIKALVDIFKRRTMTEEVIAPSNGTTAGKADDDNLGEDF